jgi:hypothetical protein
MLKMTKKEPEITSANPLAVATLTTTLKNGSKKLVEWTSVRHVRWKSNGRLYVRHVLEPILKEHLGGPAWLKGYTGLGLGLQPYDVDCRLVVDVPVEKLPDESEFDMHVEG